MMEAFRKANIFVRDTLAGVLSETDSGYEFRYDSEYLICAEASAVSLTMPLRTEAYTSKTLFAFFDGLIPEGWLLETVSRNWKISTDDRFGLLLVACRDPIGNVSVYEDNFQQEVNEND